jgi:MFS family permease
LGIGTVYNVVISTITSWFPDKRATASGIMMMCFGASSLVLGPVSGKLIHMLGWSVAAHERCPRRCRDICPFVYFGQNVRGILQGTGWPPVYQNQNGQSFSNSVEITSRTR